MTDLQTAACSSGAAADDADEFVYLGVFETSIVGIQHYRGLVNKDESLVVERLSDDAVVTSCGQKMSVKFHLLFSNIFGIPVSARPK